MGGVVSGRHRRGVCRARRCRHCLLDPNKADLLECVEHGLDKPRRALWNLANAQAHFLAPHRRVHRVQDAQRVDPRRVHLCQCRCLPELCVRRGGKCRSA
eukprot:Amastigsp_a10_4862.p4 type:complete len:100 gc:universal Amastigsp_a10_4862:353-652(+)